MDIEKKRYKERKVEGNYDREEDKKRYEEG